MTLAGLDASELVTLALLLIAIGALSGLPAGVIAGSVTALCAGAAVQDRVRDGGLVGRSQADLRARELEARR